MTFLWQCCQWCHIQELVIGNKLINNKYIARFLSTWFNNTYIPLHTVEIMIHDYAQLSGLNTPSYSIWNQISINIQTRRSCKLLTDNANIFFMSKTCKTHHAFHIQTAYKNVKTTRACACARQTSDWRPGHGSMVGCSSGTEAMVIVTWWASHDCHVTIMWQLHRNGWICYTHLCKPGYTYYKSKHLLLNLWISFMARDVFHNRVPMSWCAFMKHLEV